MKLLIKRTKKVFILQLKRIITVLVHELLRKKTETKRKTRASQRRKYITWSFTPCTLRFTEERLVWSAGSDNSHCCTEKLQIHPGFEISRDKF